MDVIYILLTALVSLFSVVYIYFKYKFNYWEKMGVPSLETRFPVGNLYGIRGKQSPILRVVNESYEKFKGKSPMAGMYFFASPWAIATDPVLIKNILIKDFKYFPDRGMYFNERDDPLSAHMFRLDGPKWKILRNKLSPTFTSGRMKFMYPTILEVTKRFHETLNDIVTRGESPIEVRELLARYTTDIIGTCAFGIECNSLKDPEADFRHYGRKIFQEPRGSTIIRMFQLCYGQYARLLRMKVFEDDVSRFFIKAIKETVEYREKNNIRQKDFLDLMIQLKNKGYLENEENKFTGKLTIEEVAAQAIIFFVAGFETSSTAMSFCLYELAMQQNIQNKLRAEINMVLDKHNGDLTYEALSEMTYMEQVLCEALRKYPPLPILTRRAIETYKVPDTKFVIEKGTYVAIPAHAIQNDPEFYPEPNKFDPDRFAADRASSQISSTFLPFGDGQRNCIGLRFGKMQARIGLAMIIKNFIITLSDTTKKAEIDFLNFILTPKDGIWLNISQVK